MVRLNYIYIVILCFLQVRCEKLYTEFDSRIFNKYVYDYITKKNITINTCIKDIFGVMKAIKQNELWAAEMIDAAAKMQSGYLEGNIINFGSYDQCLAVKGKVEDQKITGKYCLLAIYMNQFPIPHNVPNLPKSLTQGGTKTVLPLLEAVCIPESCTSENLNQILNSSVPTNFLSVVSIAFIDDFCNVQHYETEFTALHWFFLVLIAITFCLLILCTIYDLYLQKINKKPLHDIMISFSLYTNIKQLIKVKKDPDQLSCIHGIRTLSMAWVILGHKFMIESFYPHSNYLYSLRWLKENTTGFVIGALYAVDTFLLISGMLIMYIMLLAKSKNLEFNLKYYYLHRIFRLSPPLIMIILFYKTFLSTITIGTGPFSKIIYASINRPCNDYWWASMLFLQNTLLYENICVGQTWYLSTDTQLYLIAPLLFIPIQKRPKAIIAVILILSSISMLSAFVITLNMKLSVSVQSIRSAYREVYMSPVVRGSAWLIGSLLGYILFKTRKNKTPISQLVVFMMWIITTCIMCWLMYLQIYFNRTPYDKVTASLFHTFARPLWCLCISWIIFACRQGYSSLTNAFLSNRVFIILGRLSYCMYLVHIMIICITTMKRKTVTNFSNFDGLSHYWSDFIYTIVLSLIWTLCFESPIIAFGKALMSKDMSNKLTKINEENEATFNEISNNRQHITRL